MIGVGDTQDSSTWVIEGEVDDDGRLAICSSLMRVNESSSGCGGYEPVVSPGLTLVANVGMADPSLGYVAAVPNGTEATMRFTGDDSAVVEAPLRVIRPEWPFLAAAVYLEQPGLLEIVDADGTVLISQEVTQDDLVGGGFG